jgi:endo-1,3-1,4-beta-glycanase ExoK
MTIDHHAIPGAAIALAAMAGAAAAAGGQGGGFVERFDTLDRARWFVSDGWSNGDYAVNDWRASQVRAGGGLTLSLARNPAVAEGFSSGEVQSKATYLHGFYEARFRAAPGSGVVTGFFTYTGPAFKTVWNEIDVEIIGRRPREVMFTYFVGPEKRSKIIQLPFDGTKDEHVYGFEWQAGALRWFVDGRQVHVSDPRDLAFPTLPQKIMVDMWGGRTLTEWLGPFDAAALPTTAHVSCIRYAPTRTATPGC